MRQVFISFAEEDLSVAESITGQLETAGVATWRYDRDTIPGPSYLEQVIAAIDISAVVIVLISPTSLTSHQVGREIERAHELRKKFLPVLFGVTQRQLETQQPGWKLAFGTATTIRVGASPDERILDRISSGVHWLLERDSIASHYPSEKPLASPSTPVISPPPDVDPPPVANPRKPEFASEPQPQADFPAAHQLDDPWDTWFLRFILQSRIKTRTQRILRGVAYFWFGLLVLILGSIVVETEFYLEDTVDALGETWAFWVAGLLTLSQFGWLSLRMGQERPRSPFTARLVRLMRRFVGPDPRRPGEWCRCVGASFWLSLFLPLAGILLLVLIEDGIDWLFFVGLMGAWSCVTVGIWIWHSPRNPSRMLTLPGSGLVACLVILLFRHESVTFTTHWGFPFVKDRSTKSHPVTGARLLIAARQALDTQGFTPSQAHYLADSLEGRVARGSVWIRVYAYTTNSSFVAVQCRTPWGFGNLTVVDQLQREIALALKD